MINVGMIGLGPVWETRHRPALERLRDRIKVRAVYDVVASRARQLAAELNADVAPSITTLAERNDLRAVLLLDAGWHGSEALRLLTAHGKPTYIAGRISGDLASLQDFRALQFTQGITLMPEFGRRYTPATCRLHELIATRIGRPQRVRIEGRFPEPEHPEAIPGRDSGTDYLIGWFDWCRHVLRGAPVSLKAEPLDSRGNSNSGLQICIQYASRSEGRPLVAELQFLGPDDRLDQDSARNSVCAANTDCEHRLSVSCTSGTAVLEGTTRISWENGIEHRAETLTSDRTEVEVMLDHFCRRVVGGLIPVADINDVCRSMIMAHAAEESLRTGQTVTLDGQN